MVVIGVTIDAGDIRLGGRRSRAVEAADHLGGAASCGEANGHTSEAGELGGGPRCKVEEAGGDTASAAAGELGEEGMGLGSKRAKEGNSDYKKRHAPGELLDVEVVVLAPGDGTEVGVDRAPNPVGSSRTAKVCLGAGVERLDLDQEVRPSAAPAVDDKVGGVGEAGAGALAKLEHRSVAGAVGEGGGMGEDGREDGVKGGDDGVVDNSVKASAQRACMHVHTSWSDNSDVVRGVRVAGAAAGADNKLAGARDGWDEEEVVGKGGGEVPGGAEGEEVAGAINGGGVGGDHRDSSPEGEGSAHSAAVEEASAEAGRGIAVKGKEPR